MYRLRLLILHHYNKIGAKILIYAQIMAQNEIQNGGRRHLKFNYF